MIGLDKDILDTLASLSDIPVKEREADKDTPYPYFVFETRRLSSDNGIDSYILEINGWISTSTIQGSKQSSIFLRISFIP